ncbi:MAG: biotin/lipoyl-containing protein, partial [Specibacter sp.]
MSESVLLPALGESVTEGTVTRWLKAIGERVSIDEPLVEVSTDKVDTEIPSPFAGILANILVPEDETAEIGTVLAIIAAEESAPAVEPAPVVAPPAPVAVPAVAAVVNPQTLPTPASPAGDSSGQWPRLEAKPLATVSYFTPLVRKLARQLNVDLSAVAGSGLGGRVRADDVRKAAASFVRTLSATAATATPAAPSISLTPAKAKASPVTTGLRGTVVKAPRIRAVIASRMRESLDTSTQLTQVHEVDVTGIVRLREKAKAQFAAVHGVKLTYLPFIAQAVAEALK